jgi:hypothetical protein
VDSMYPPLKHYVYISDTKVDMYYAQIPSPLLESIAAELTIDLKVFGSGVSTTLRRDAQDKTRYDKLQVVIKYLEEHRSSDIGWIDSPLTYFKGVLPLYWGKLPTRDNTKMVFFAGKTEQTLLTLGGSTYHVIGKVSDATIGEPSSDLPSLVDILGEELQLHPRSPNREEFYDEDAALNAIEIMMQQMRGTSQSLEFIAKKLAYDPSSLTHGRRRRRAKHVLFGTPIYVALAE